VPLRARRLRPTLTIGSLVNGRLMTLDTTAMLSAGRQSFATLGAYHLCTPVFWKRYAMTLCSPPLGVVCEPPTGPTCAL
jgi:hypothetical protein